MARSIGTGREGSASQAVGVRVVWTIKALREIERIHDYLLAFNPDAATRVVVELREAGSGLINFPLRGRVVPGTALRELVTAFPYVMRYRVSGGQIFILRIRHAARRPTEP